MAIRFRPGVDVVELLKRAGYTTYRLRKEHILGERALTKFRRGNLPSWNELDTVCTLLHVQPADLLEHCGDEKPSSDG